jgi:hypothetical protein
MKVGTENHLKTKRLKRLLGKPCYAVVGLLESLWLLTISSADEGDVGRFSNEEIADAIEWDGDADALIDALITAGWLDRDDERRLVVHDWLDHCPKYIKDRLRQRRHRSPSPTARDEQADERPLSPPPCDTEREPRPKSPLTQPNPTQPIPTTPTMRRDPVAVAVDELLKAGISNATPTVETAIDNGLDVEGIRAVIRYWQTRTDLQGGALVKRLSLADARLPAGPLRRQPRSRPQNWTTSLAVTKSRRARRTQSASWRRSARSGSTVGGCSTACANIVGNPATAKRRS